MFFYVLRAAKGEHGEDGKLVWVRWLPATVMPGLFFLQRLGGVGAGGAEASHGYYADGDVQYYV